MIDPTAGVFHENSPNKNPGIRRLSGEDVRRIAKLARLDLSEGQVVEYQSQLSAVLGYMGQLGALDTSGIEPMTHPPHPGERTNVLDTDTPRTPDDTLLTRALLDIAPKTMGPFVRVPKVLGEGGGA